MAITKLNSLAIPPNTITESDLTYPLTNFSSTGIDDNATSNAVTIDSNQRVGVGTNNPGSPLHVRSGSSTGASANAYTVLALEGANPPTLQFLSPNNTFSQIRFGDPEDNGSGGLDYNHSTDQMNFWTNGVYRLSIDSSGVASFSGNLETEGDISLPHAAANIDFGGETYGGPHGLNFLTDDTGGAVHWGFYYRTSPDTITLELNGTDKKLLLNTTGELHIDNDVIAFSTTTSDSRFKDQVETIDGALDKVMALRGVEYTWNATARKGERDMGLIAQEVEAVIPIIVREKTLSTGEWSDNPTPAKTVDYEKLTAVLIEAVKELKAEVDALKGGQ